MMTSQKENTMKVMRGLLISMFVLLLFNSNVMANERNDVIFDAMSPYEDLTEYALNKETLQVANSISSLDGLIAKLKDVVSNQTMQNLEIIVKKLQAAEKQKNYSEIALLAVDSYKILADELDQTTLKVPKQVVMLDYVGFKIHALLRKDKINWHLIAEMVDEGKKQWEQVKAKVTSKGLYDSVNTTIRGLERAATSKNIDMLYFAAQVDLDLVDLLEGFFEKTK
jgi:hypothetical protein